MKLISCLQKLNFALLYAHKTKGMVPFEVMEVLMSFTKTCKICGATFESEARNTIYCSDKCAERGAKKAYRKRKMKHINAVRSADDKEIENLITAAYKLSRDVAKMCLLKKCACTDENHVCDGDLQVHHIDHNPFNCHPSNLMWVCEKAHNEIHASEEDCSIDSEIKAWAIIRKQAEIRERNATKRAEKKEQSTEKSC